MAFKIVVILIAIFFYSFNLHATQSFVGDSARDTVRMLEIWQNKEITLLGPPLSLGFGSAREVYFGSLSLYVGLIGILLSNLDPIGAVLPNIILFALSIPIFFAWVKKISNTKYIAHLATIIYALNPLTVNYARFFWNPNLIIPLSVIFWYLVSISSIFWAGFVLGLMFNFHYLGILGGVLYGVYLIFQKKWLEIFKYIFGFIVGIIPLLIFELRNNFYLSKTLLWNLNSGDKIWALIEKPPIIVGLINTFLTPIGFIHSELGYPTLFKLSNFAILILSIVIGFLIIKKSIYIYMNSTHTRTYIIVLFASIILLNLSDAAGHTRYIWSVLPIALWLLTETIISLKNKYLILLIMVFIIGNSLINVFTERGYSDDLIPFRDLESISQIIVADNPEGRYNISESITGDARFISLRYFLMRDAGNKPQDKEHYTNLDSLYIVTKDGKNAMDGDRWEFTATPNLVESASWKTGSLRVFKYER